MNLIAVVDDDRSVHEALENVISSVGYEVKIFASAEAFLDSDAPLQTGLRGFGLVAAGQSGLSCNESWQLTA